MARHKVIHSEDACCIFIRGDRRSPEPSTAIVRFPGGSIEVSRHSDGSYWIHASRCVEPRDEDVEAGEIAESRIDYALGERPADAIAELPAGVEHFALRIRRRP